MLLIGSIDLRLGRYNGAALTWDKKYFINVPPDEETYYLNINWIKAVANNLRKVFHIDKWALISSTLNMPFKEGGFLALDVFEIEAIYTVVSDMLHQQEKAQKKSMQAMNDKIDLLNEARNQGFNIQKPNFLS